MEPIQFQSAKFKIQRAHHHIKELTKLLDDFYLKKTGIHVFARKEKGRYVLTAFARPDPIPPEASLILGDIVHNIRTAYDHAVVNYTEGKGRLAMPTGKTRKDIEDSSIPFKKLKEIDPVFAAKILDELQPYENGDCMIWEIAQLDNQDKHNLLIPTFSVSQVRGIAVIDHNGNSFNGIVAQLDHGEQQNVQTFNSPITVVGLGEAFGMLIFSDSVLEGESVIGALTHCVHHAFKTLVALELFCYGKVTNPNTLE